jgi:hypothetical protein
MNTPGITDFIVIPGWMTLREMHILHTLAGHVPHGGSILELGCYLGRSTTALWLGAKETVELTVIDTFKFEHWLGPGAIFDNGPVDLPMFERACEIGTASGSQAAFKYCVGDALYNNIKLHAESSKQFKKTKNYNLTFIDASHLYEDVMHDLEKFSSDGDLIIGDDFESVSPGVTNAVINFNAGSRRTLVVFENTKLWALVPKFGYWRDLFRSNNILLLHDNPESTQIRN